MYSVAAIADELLRIAKERGKALTPLQLMKLVYIAHGWSLGLDRGDLFANRIEAWKYGPVIPDLYRITKKYGRNEIPLSLVGAGPSMVELSTSAFLKDVYEKYGHLSGVSLSRLTHLSGTPWDVIYKSGEYNAEIPDALIREHYKRLLNERANSSAAA